MRWRSIRVRLTAWYFAVLAVTFILFGMAMFLAIRASVHAAVDGELRVRLKGVQRFMERHIRATLEELQDELREHSGLKPGGDLLQVADAGGHWVFRSGSIQPYRIPLPTAAGLNDLHFETTNVAGTPLRILSARIQVSGRPYTVQLANPIGEFYEMLNRLRLIVLSSIPLVLLIASAGGYWMSRRALAPVDEITQTARSISARNLSRRLAVPQTGDELQRLSETLNDMIARLDSTFKRITQFTADASHELRTPLALLRTTTEIALQKQRSESDYREALEQIEAELERTTYLIDNLMTLARADSGAEALRMSQVDIVESVRQACEQGEILSRSKQVAFERVIPENRLAVKGDPQALRRLFLILIDNAVKYTPAGGKVAVSLRQMDNTAIGEVTDSGIGISAEDLPNIFERFYRADKARSRDMGGAGLGLSIAHWIAEAHHISIEAASSPGRGSTFRVRIPLNEG